MLKMSAYTRLLKQMVEMVPSSPWRQRLGATARGKTVLVMIFGIGCWWCVELALEKGDVPFVEEEHGVCHFDCGNCKCNCQAIFKESKHNKIANALRKNAEKGKPHVETLELQREGGHMFYFIVSRTILTTIPCKNSSR